VREPGESLTITLALKHGREKHLFQGSCAAISYSGAGGREKRFFANEILQELHQFDFAGAIERIVRKPSIETIRELLKNERGTAKTYGLSQLLIQVAAFADDVTVSDFIAKYTLSHTLCPITLHDHLQSILNRTANPANLVDLPLFIQTGDNRSSMVEEIIGNLNVSSIVAYPHGLFNSRAKIETLPSYLERWSQYEMDICGETKSSVYLHCDTYGQVGELINGDRVSHYDKHLVEKVGDWILDASKHTKKKLRIEGPIEIKPDLNASDTDEQKKRMVEHQAKANASLLAYLYRHGFQGQIVSDENINSVADMRKFLEEIKRVCRDENLSPSEVLNLYMIQIKTPTLGDFTQIIDAVLYCASEEVSVYVGGTCNETNISASLVYTVSSVLRPLIAQVVLRPGMDVRMGLLSFADWQNSFIQEYLLRA
jgi:methylaspartate ammonia-lyase